MRLLIFIVIVALWRRAFQFGHEKNKKQEHKKATGKRERQNKNSTLKEFRRRVAREFGSSSEGKSDYFERERKVREAARKRAEQRKREQVRNETVFEVIERTSKKEEDTNAVQEAEEKEFSLAEAMVWKEILDAPVSMREPRF